LQVAHLVAAAFALWHDVVNVCGPAAHDSLARSTLVAISKQHLTACCLPPRRAIASSRSRWSCRVWCPLSLLTCQPRGL